MERKDESPAGVGRIPGVGGTREIKREVLTTSQLSTQPAHVLSHTSVLETAMGGAVGRRLSQATTQELDAALLARREFSQRKERERERDREGARDRSDRGESEPKKARLPALPEFGQVPVEQFDLTREDEEGDDVMQGRHYVPAPTQVDAPGVMGDELHASYAQSGALRGPEAVHSLTSMQAPPLILSLQQSLDLVHSKMDQAHQQVSTLGSEVHHTKQRVGALEDVARHHNATQAAAMTRLDQLEKEVEALRSRAPSPAARGRSPTLARQGMGGREVSPAAGLFSKGLGC